MSKSAGRKTKNSKRRDRESVTVVFDVPKEVEDEKNQTPDTDDLGGFDHTEISKEGMHVLESIEFERLKRKSPDSADSLDSPLRKKRKIEPPGAPVKAKRSEAAAQTAAKHWCFTWNNPIGDDGMMFDIVKEWPTDYLVFQREQGEAGTTHLQGYVEFEKPMRFNGLKKMPFAGMFTWTESTRDCRPIIIIK